MAYVEAIMSEIEMMSNKMIRSAKKILNSLNVCPMSGRINTATYPSELLNLTPTVLSVSLSKSL